MLSVSKVRQWNSAKIGLVLSGGGAKGAYEAGVFKALHLLDIADKICAVSGTSVGALNTLMFAMYDPALAEGVWDNIGFKDVLSRPDKENKTTWRELYSQFFSDSKKDHDKRALSEKLMDISKADAILFTQDKLRELLTEAIDFDKVSKSGIDLYACAYNLDYLKPEYFYLNGMDGETMLNVVLASAAIPYVFPPVTINGTLYADGGVNNPAYPTKNGDVTPIAPLAKYRFDTIIVIHLNNEPWSAAGFEYCEIVDIYPSEPLEPIKGAGTLNFSRNSVENKLEQGFSDAMAMLAPWLIKRLS